MEKNNQINCDENSGVDKMDLAQEEFESVDQMQLAQEEAEESHAPKVLSPTRLLLKRFFRSKLSVLGLCTLIVLFAFSFIGPIFSVWGEIEVDETMGKSVYLQTEVEFVGADGQTYIVYDVTSDVLTQNLLAPPSRYHWLGTDERGMDVFTRLMYGGRISLTLGFIVVFLSTSIGVILGGLSGYLGKWVDQVIMRVVDVFQCLPTLPILLIASAIIEAMKVPPHLRIYYLMIILTVFSWSGTARLVRGQILALREQEYMVAAEASGLSLASKLFKHLIPNILPQLIVSMTLGLGGIILYESTLSYLGLGVPLPYAAWGTIISSAQNPEILGGYYNIWIPAGVLIVLAVLAFNFIGDGLRDAFDPKMRR